ncbi:hypothetical protein GOC31_20825 [Sinorhizobium meliloti]|nr:hypothetical protein [Sinorhizobium meliloti]
MEQTLAEFLRAYGEKPWQPGKVDCCLFLAAWAVWLGYPDPARHLRGAYDGEEGFREIIEKSGSVTVLVGSCASLIRGRRLQRPICGAIGVIGSATNIHRQFGAIHDGERWQVRLKNGIGPMTAQPLGIWFI